MSKVDIFEGELNVLGVKVPLAEAVSALGEHMVARYVEAGETPESHIVVRRLSWGRFTLQLQIVKEKPESEKPEPRGSSETEPAPALEQEDEDTRL